MAAIIGMSGADDISPLVKTRPMMMPKNTATPPKTGTGVDCNLRALGLSTMFFLCAIFTIIGCIQITAIRDVKNAISMLFNI
jgi:hypothetical protein